jgi:hypothetical protein
MDDTWFEEFLAELGDAHVRFWVCPISGHSEGTWRTDRMTPTVEWNGNVARCLAPGCARTSKSGDEPRG